MINPRNTLKTFLFFSLISIFFFTSLGCEPLRKKFTRQKKKEQKEEFTPVLDPIDYPAAVRSPAQDYKRAYGLWKVWNKEFLQEIEKNDNEKRQKYLLNESVEQLQAMRNLIQENKRGSLNQAIGNLNSVKEEYQLPVAMRQMSAIKRKIERNANAVINHLNPQSMENFLNAAQ